MLVVAADVEASALILIFAAVEAVVAGFVAEAKVH